MVWSINKNSSFYVNSLIQLRKIFFHKDLQNETNSFGLTGESLKAAKVLVEKTIIARRNSWQNGKEESKKSIEEIQKDLGL